MEQLISPKETSKILGVSVETLSQWRHHKRYNLPYVKSGRLVRYRNEDIEAFIASRIRSGGCDHAIRT